MILLLFHFLFLVITFLYYKSPILYGGFDFLEFLKVIILNSALISTPIIVSARIYSVKLIPIQDENIIFKGEKKTGFFKNKEK